MDADDTPLDTSLDPSVDARFDDTPEVTPEPVAEASAPLDLDAIQRDLADVEVALARLDAGTYWTDEVTGQELPAELLAQHPTARRVLAE